MEITLTYITFAACSYYYSGNGGFRDKAAQRLADGSLAAVL